MSRSEKKREGRNMMLEEEEEGGGRKQADMVLSTDGSRDTGVRDGGQIERVYDGDDGDDGSAVDVMDGAE